MDARTDIFFRSPVPIAQQDGVNNESGFSLAEKQIANRLPHQVAPSEGDKDRYRVDGFADVRDGVGDRNGAKNLRYIVVPFLSEADLERRRELTAIVEQVHV